MTKLFGTDGIRCNAGSYPMNAASVLKIAKLCAIRFKKNGSKALIGKDTRASCCMFESCLIAGILSCGIDVELVGILPTPAISMLTKSLNCAFGVVVSASHNQYQDNGLKFFNHKGLKISAQDEAFIEDNFDKKLDIKEPLFGKVAKVENAGDLYINYAQNCIDQKTNFSKIKIALDCANGSAYDIGPKIFNKLGAKVEVINNQPSGCNINLDCGTMFPQGLQHKVKECGADIGFAFDGDADRLVVCDETGKIVDGDQLIATIAHFLFCNKKLNKNSVVITHASSLMLKKYLQDIGINVIECDVGDKNVLKSMQDSGAGLGAESSGHIIIKDLCQTSDALIACLQFIFIAKMQGVPISKLTKKFTPIPKIELNIKIDKNFDCKQLLIKLKNWAIKQINSKEKLIIRKSGTENLIRVMIESNDKKKAENLARKISDYIKKMKFDIEQNIKHLSALV